MADDDSTDVGERVSGDVETTAGLLGNYYRGELDVEDDEGYWYPLWPESSRGHPWD